MNLEEYKGVFVFAQQVDNELTPIAFELIGKGKDLAKDLNTDVTAVLIGSDVKSLADELAEYGADKVIVVDDPELKDYRTEPYAHALASVIKEYKPEIMLVGATAIGRDLGPRVSARVKTGLTADCTVLEIGEFKGVANQRDLCREAAQSTGIYVFKSAFCPCVSPDQKHRRFRPEVIWRGWLTSNNAVIKQRHLLLIHIIYLHKYDNRIYRLDCPVHITGRFKCSSVVNTCGYRHR